MTRSLKRLTFSQLTRRCSRASCFLFWQNAVVSMPFCYHISLMSLVSSLSVCLLSWPASFGLCLFVCFWLHVFKYGTITDNRNMTDRNRQTGEDSRADRETGYNTHKVNMKIEYRMAWTTAFCQKRKQDAREHRAA